MEFRRLEFRRLEFRRLEFRRLEFWMMLELVNVKFKVVADWASKLSSDLLFRMNIRTKKVLPTMYRLASKRKQIQNELREVLARSRLLTLLSSSMTEAFSSSITR